VKPASTHAAKIRRFTPAAACLAGAVAAASVYVTAQAPTFDTITYKDSGGFAGGGTGKSLKLTGEGEVTAQVLHGPSRTLRLQDQDMAALKMAVAAVDWEHLETWYSTRGAADLVIRDLTVVVQGHKYETHADDLARVPEALAKLFIRLDELYRQATTASRR
jgi:hypothetical protein